MFHPNQKVIVRNLGPDNPESRTGHYLTDGSTGTIVRRRDHNTYVVRGVSGRHPDGVEQIVGTEDLIAFPTQEG